MGRLFGTDGARGVANTELTCELSMQIGRAAAMVLTKNLNGKKPIIVEMQDDLITTPGICLANTSYLRDFFKTNNVPVHLETALVEINEGSVTLKGKDGNAFTVDTDSVILSVGYKPAPIAEGGKHVHVIGDALKVGNLRSVIWGAWTVCMKL